MEHTEPRVNGFVNYCGIHVGVPEDGRCEGWCDIEERHLNPWGSAHGGFSFTMMDTVAGTALKSVADGRGFVTVSSSVSFLRPVMPGRAICTAELVKNGRKIAVVDARICSEDGKLLARGTFEFCCTE